VSTLQEIEAAILELSGQDRLHLADKILGSLPQPPAAMESEEILAEAVRRDQDLESGALEPLSEEAFWAEATREAYSGILEILRLRSRD
jgi:putative addiction module component (TIGR02574 family)